MCKVLEREGHEWALDTLRKMQGLATGPNGARRIIEQMERGKRAKPASYAKGVQQVIDKVRHVARTQTAQQA